MVSDKSSDSAPSGFPAEWLSVAVIGMGTMGAGIAAAAVLSGLDVTVYDPNAQVVAKAEAKIRDRLERSGKTPAPAITRAGTVADAVADVDVVIECVPELVEIKSTVLSDVMAACRPDALVATNTSTMSIGELQAASGHAGQRLVGLHFFNPAHKMRLVEVVLQGGQDSRYREASDSFVRRIGKDPIFVKDVPGFVTSRMGLVLGNEAMNLLDRGFASAEDIDAAMRLGYNHPMGPLELADLVGLDARLNNVRALHRASGDDRYRPPVILERLVSEGKLGRKSGAGFYTYGENS